MTNHNEGFSDGELLLSVGIICVAFFAGALAMWMYMGGGL